MARRATRSILMFHGIGTPPVAIPDDEHAYWVDWNLFDEVIDYCGTLPLQADRLTFDDGNISDLEAARRMRRAGLSGSFFVLVGRIGAPGYLGEEDLRELIDLGMEIGLHGRDHRDWRRVDDATLVSEIDRAREELAAICARPIEYLAIPYGAYDRRVWTYLQNSAFRRIYTSDRGVSAEESRFIRRNTVTRQSSFAQIVSMLHDDVPPQTRLRRAVMPVLKRRI